MGCICSKEDVAESEPAERLQKAPSQSLTRLVTLAAKKPDSEAPPAVHAVVVVVDENSSSRGEGKKDNGGAPVLMMVKEMERKAQAAADDSFGEAAAPTHHRRATVDIGGDAADEAAEAVEGNDADPGLAISGVPHGFSGEHVIAGWPSWLTSVAGEVVQGWLPRRANTFERLDKIGQGTYSNVYKARDLETGKIVALKRVRFVNMDRESVRFMAREIHMLRRLDHPNVIKLEGILTSRLSNSLYLVFEYMDHDLAGLASIPGLRFTEPQVKCFMKQLLDGLGHCHGRGVLHRDIKGSNLLIDSNGVLKIADFGLATFFDPDQKQPLTSRVVTLWYRPPELLLGATEYGVAVDMWSTGCILAELLAGKPILPGQTEIEQLHKIFKLCGSPSEEYWAKAKLPDVTLFRPQWPYRRKIAEAFKDFPPTALSLLDKLLAIEPPARGTAASALASEFFRSKPLACDPSSLPKHPPTKEYDAKLRNKEARRQTTSATGRHGSMSVKPGRDESQDANNKHQTRQAHTIPKSVGHGHGSVEDTARGFLIEPSGSPVTTQTAGFGSTWHRKGAKDDPRTVQCAASSFRVPNASHQNLLQSDVQSRGTELHPSSTAAKNADSRYNRLDVAELATALDRPGPTHRKDWGMRDGSAGLGGRNKRIHYSGLLVPAGGSMEDMLRELERQIQQTVRKVRVDKRQTDRPYHMT